MSEAVAQQQLDPDTIRDWLDLEAQRMATRQNFPQICQDPLTGETVDFGQYTDPDEVMQKSREVEQNYLREIQKRRDKFVHDSGTNNKVKAVREFERTMAETDLYYLTKYISGQYPDLAFHFHYFMCQCVQDLKSGDRFLLEFPRGSYKSTCLNIMSNVQKIIRNPNIRILIKSNSERNAASKLIEAKKHFIMPRATPNPYTEEYAYYHPFHAGPLGLTDLFPEMVPKTTSEKGSNTEWDCPAKTIGQAEKTLTAAGVGTSKVSQHYDFVLGDDVWDYNSVTSAEQLTKAIDEMSEFKNLLTKQKSDWIGFINTRYAHDDPTPSFQEDPQYRVQILSAITPEGGLTFPENMDGQSLYNEAQSNRYNFSCQKMLNPTDESQGFSRDWIKYLSYEQLLEEYHNNEINMVIRLLTDATVEEGMDNDNAAVVAVVFDSKERITVVEATRQKMQPTDFINELYRLGEKYRVEFAVRQKTALETTIMHFVNREQKERRENDRYVLRFHDHSLRKREKKMRITAALQPPMQKGYLYFDPSMQTINEVEKELLDHPNTRKDDVLDALSEIDDPAVSRIPKHEPPQKEEPEQYLPHKEGAPDDFFRRQKAQQAFEQYRQPQRQNLRPGARIP